MSSSSNTGNELAGWKQIASFLDVSVPTARRYFRDLELPVTQRGNRFFALPADLEAWKRAGNPRQQSQEEPASRAAPEARESTRSRPPFMTLLPSSLLIGSAVLALWVALSPWPPKPAKAVIEDSALKVYDSREELLWEVSLSEFDTRQMRLTPPLLRDVDADGRLEVIVNFFPSKEKAENGSVVCFDESGRRLWTFDFGRKLARGDRPFARLFDAELIDWIPTEDDDLLLVIANHSVWYPSQVALLDPLSGDLVGEYWHPGNIYSFAVRGIEELGEQELWLGGTNNPGSGYGRPSLAVLPIPFGSNDRTSLFGLSSTMSG